MHEPNLPDLAEVLAEVNRIRSEHGEGPASKIPPGARNHPAACPLAYALGGYVGATSFRIGDDHQPLPAVLLAFRRAFDNGAYPELVA